MKSGFRAYVTVVFLATFAPTTVQAQLTGHGGPVRALAVSRDGLSLLSGSFDTAAIRWSLKSDSAEQVLRFHSDAVNAVAFLPGNRMVTAGADARIAVWTAERQEPDRVFEGHQGPIAAIAVSPDASLIASASWDHTVRLWSLADGAVRVLEGHAQNVNGVAFTPDGKTVVSVGYDLTLRRWPVAGGTPEIVPLPSPLNAVLVSPRGEIVVAAADGKVRLLTPDGKNDGEIEAGATPIVALALSADDGLIAAAGIGGTVAIIDRKQRRVLRTLAQPGVQVWSIAFLKDGKSLLTGGSDGKIRRWNAHTGETADSIQPGISVDPLVAYAGDHGAEVFRACVACHTLSANEPKRAGPTLAGLYGRRIASLPGYRFSDALKKLDIVWSPETVAKLFEFGPNSFTPGTKMPEQRIGSVEDRKALTDFLTRATSR
jgi:cytochrome c